MQTVWNQVLPSSSSAIRFGVVAPQSNNIYAGNPLQHYSYDPFGQPKNLTPPRSQTTMMKLSIDGKFIAFASDIVDLMDLERGKVVLRFTDHTNSVTGLCNDKTTHHIWATVGMDRTMRIFNSRQRPGQIACFRSNFRHRCLTYSHDSGMLFCGGENILIYDVRKNLEFNSIKTDNQVLDINCHPDDYVVLSCTDDRRVKVWDINTKECLSQSFPLESQPQKVLFDEGGSVVLACTAEKLYTCSWEPFEVISQHSWSKSKQLSKLMVKTEENRMERKKAALITSMSAPLTTMDMKIVDGMVMHLGISGSSRENRCLELRSVSVERLLTPQVEDKVFVNEANSPLKFDDETDLEEAFIHEEDDPEAVLIPPPLILSPTKTPTLIRKLPRSTSSSRSNLQNISASSAPKKSPAFAMSAPLKTRSSSSNAIHSSDPRTNTAIRTQKKELPPKLPQIIRTRTSQPEPKKSSLAHRRSSRGLLTFEEMRASSSNFLSMMTNRQAGVQRVKATIKSRNNNEDEVFAEAINLSDKAAFVQLLEQLSSKSIGLKLAARILPELRFLLSHENSNFVNTALNLLDEIVTQLKEAIQQGLSSNAQSIGVDVAAEQRQLLCVKCKEALIEIYVNSDFLTANFNEEQHLQFTSTTDKFMDLVL